MNFLRFLLTLYRNYPARLITIVCLLILVSAAEATAILSLPPIIDLLTQPNPGEASDITRHLFYGMKKLGMPGNLKSFVILMFGFILLKSFFMIFAQWMIEKTRQHVQRSEITETFRFFLDARWQFFTSQDHGALANTLFHQVSEIARAFYATASILASVFRMVMYLSITLWISWSLLLVTLGLVAFAAIPFLGMGRYAYRLAKRNTVLANLNVKTIQETLAAAKMIIGFGRRRESVQPLTELLKNQQEISLKSQLLNHTSSYILEPVGLLILIAVFYFARKYQHLPLSEVIVIFYAMRMLIPQLSNIIVKRNDVQSALPAWEQLTELKNTAIRQAQPQGNKIFSGFKKGMVLQDVHFSYIKDKPVLTGIHAEILKGQRVAFVGASGGGKTTLIDLIMGLYEPSGGEILVDGTPLREFDLVSWQKRIGYVLQDNFFFDTTIRENLLWSDEKATSDELIQACRLAQAHTFIQALPQGYDTFVGNRGVRLSEGERQRIALARAILRKPDLLILDEATSALDSQSESLIQKAIEEIAQETTVIMVAHRFSTITQADRVYVLEGGTIIDEGTFTELIAADRGLHEIAQLQMKLEIS